MKRMTDNTEISQVSPRYLLGVAGLTMFFYFCPKQVYAFDIGYSGRVSESEGKPIDGPVDILVRFYSSLAGSDQLGTTQNFSQVPLADGVFQLQIALDSNLTNQVFGNGVQPVFIEIEVAGKIYPRQQFLAVPYALRVPVDKASLVFAPDGTLTVNQVSQNQVSGLSSSLASKADATALSTKADQSTLNAALSTKAKATHVHTMSDVTGLSAALTSKADANAAVGGDVGGTLGSVVVNKIKGVSVTAPVGGTDTGKYLQYNGTDFVWSGISGATGGTVTNQRHGIGAFGCI